MTATTASGKAAITMGKAVTALLKAAKALGKAVMAVAVAIRLRKNSPLVRKGLF